MQIKSTHFLNENNVEKRKIKVTLTNGTKITIEACHESWEQWGGTEEELWLTVPIAEKHNNWLHGID